MSITLGLTLQYNSGCVRARAKHTPRGSRRGVIIKLFLTATLSS